MSTIIHPRHWDFIRELGKRVQLAVLVSQRFQIDARKQRDAREVFFYKASRRDLGISTSKLLLRTATCVAKAFYNIPPQSFHSYLRNILRNSLLFASYSLELDNRQSFDIIHGRWAYPAGLASILLGNVRKRKTVVSLLGYDVQGFAPEGYGALADPYLFAISRFVIRKADAAIVQHPYHREFLIQQGAAPEKLFYIPFGVDMSIFEGGNSSEARQLLGFSQEDRFVIFGSYFKKMYGADSFCEAALKVLKSGVKCKFVMVGTGPLKEALQEQCQSSGFGECFFFPGFVPREKFALLLSASEFVCDLCQVGQGILTIEGHACGKPVVGFMTAKSRIIEGVDGFLVEKEDTSQLADRMVWLLENPAQATRMGENGKRKVALENSVQNEIDKLLDVYHRVLQKQS